MSCPALNIAHLVGKKWSVVLLEEISLGKFDGFNNVLKRSHLTPRILSNQLKEMEALSIINKNDAGRYTITKKGSELREIVCQIKNFSRKWDSKSNDCANKSCLECKEFK